MFDEPASVARYTRYRCILMADPRVSARGRQRNTYFYELSQLDQYEEALLLQFMSTHIREVPDIRIRLNRPSHHPLNTADDLYPFPPPFGTSPTSYIVQPLFPR